MPKSLKKAIEEELDRVTKLVWEANKILDEMERQDTEIDLWQASFTSKLRTINQQIAISIVEVQALLEAF
jgi:hypothetical protein